MEFEKRTDQNFITQNLRHNKEYCISKKKTLFKQCLKEVLNEYILVFAAWWSIFWEMVGSGGYILAGGAWWWVAVDIFWMVVGAGGWWWIYFGWWWAVVGRGIV